MAGAFSKHRQQIYHSQQHPYKHGLAEFAYTNPVMPGVTNLESAVDWMLSVIYPMSQSSVAIAADLQVGGVVTFSVGTPGVVNFGGAQQYGNTDQVYFTTTGTLPVGLSPNTVYYIQDVLLGTFNVSTDKDGVNTINFVGTGVGVHTIHNANYSYRVVLNDGDGNAASYRWEQREGEATYSWHKVYDMDWGQDAILTAFMAVTQEQYVAKYGIDDKDGTGTPLAGDSAGQHVFGGASANTNLTLHANSGDGVGPATGFVQFADQVRPFATNAIDLGTLTKLFKDAHFAGVVNVGTMAISQDTIFTAEPILTLDAAEVAATGTITAAADMVATGKVSAGAGELELQDSVTAGSPTIFVPGQDVKFGDGGTNEVIVDAQDGTFTAKTIQAKEGVETLILDADSAPTEASITATKATISFGTNNLKTTGTLNTGAVTATSLQVDQINIDGSTVTSSVDLNLQAGAANKVIAKKALLAEAGAEVQSGLNVSSGNSDLNNVRVAGATITAQVGDLVLAAAAGVVSALNSILPSTDNTFNLGSALLKWATGFFVNISDGTNSIATSVLTTFRNYGTPNTGDSLFWDGTKWVASAPDIEIDHSTVTGLTTGDAGHTQFAMLAGRAGGQILQGGTVASEELVLESTAHATKGLVKTKDTLTPFANVTYSGGWLGVDLGSSSLYFRDLYTRGELKGARAENFGTPPAFSALNSGRMIWDTAVGTPKWDVGTHFRRAIVETGEDDASGGTVVPTTEALVLRVTAKSVVSTIVAPSADYKVLVLVNATGAILTITNNTGSSNSIITGTAANLEVEIDASIILVYDQSTLRWRVAGGSGGGFSNKVTEVSIGGAAEFTLDYTKKFQTISAIAASIDYEMTSITPFGLTALANGSIVVVTGKSDTLNFILKPSDNAKGIIMDGNISFTRGKSAQFMYNSNLDRYVRIS